MLSALALWAVLAVVGLLMPLQLGQEQSDPGRSPKSLDHQGWNVALTAHQGQWSVVRGGKARCSSHNASSAREPWPECKRRGCWQREGLRHKGGRLVRQGQGCANLQPQKTVASTLEKPLPVNPLLPKQPRSSRHLLKGIQTPCVFKAFHDLPPHLLNTAQISPPRAHGETRPYGHVPCTAPGKGEAPGSSQGHRSSKRADFVCSLLFTAMSPSDQNRAWHIVGA